MAEQEQDGVEVGNADRGVGRIPDDGFGVEGDAETGGIEHVEVVRTVADGHGSLGEQPLERDYTPNWRFYE